MYPSDAENRAYVTEYAGSPDEGRYYDGIVHGLIYGFIVAAVVGLILTMVVFHDCLWQA